MWRRSYPLLVLMILLILTALIISSRRPTNQEVSLQSDGDNPLGLRCEAACSEELIREPVAVLTWRATEAQLNQQSLEVTAYKNGFEKGLLVRLFPRITGTPGAGDQIEPSQQQQLPGLDRIAIAQVNLLRDRGLVEVRVAGVQGGVNYFWRLRSADGSIALSSVIRRKILACPTDLKPQESQPR